MIADAKFANNAIDYDKRMYVPFQWKCIIFLSVHSLYTSTYIDNISYIYLDATSAWKIKGK
jgi:hypothetical protein